MPRSEAAEIVEEVLFHLENEVKVVTTSDIFTLCVTNDEFCIFMKKFTLSDGKKKWLCVCCSLEVGIYSITVLCVISALSVQGLL